MGRREITLGIAAEFSEINRKRRSNVRNRGGIQRDKWEAEK